MERSRSSGLAQVANDTRADENEDFESLVRWRRSLHSGADVTDIGNSIAHHQQSAEEAALVQEQVKSISAAAAGWPFVTFVRAPLRRRYVMSFGIKCLRSSSQVAPLMRSETMTLHDICGDGIILLTPDPRCANLPPGQDRASARLGPHAELKDCIDCGESRWEFDA